MKTSLKIILFFLLPILAVILFPPQTLVGGIPVVLFAIVAFSLVGFSVMRGRRWALTFLIFLMGFNVIIRIMMFISQVVPANGNANPMFIITSLAAIALSLWLLLRLDNVDVRTTIVD